MTPVRPGESGELCTAGDGVARGYLHDPEVTAAKFLPNPFARDPQQRLYRTGDLARWLTEGTIEFLGRLDDQVKILGHRIEPGEIESLLMQNESVKQACVVPRIDTNGGKRLAAYFVPKTNTSVTPEELKDFVASRLPQHMIPAFFVSLDSLPLSARGKVDRQALAKLEIPAREPHKQNRAGTHLERTIADLWQRVLNAPQVGLDDNFFDLGGDSLLLVAVHSNLQKILQTEIPLTDLFEFATVRRLARHLGEGASGSPVFSEVQQRAQRQRQAFTRLRESRAAVDCESQ
jgi:acyl carrier protein